MNNGPLSNEKRLFWVPPAPPDKLGYVLITQPELPQSHIDTSSSGPVDRFCFGLNTSGLSIAYTLVGGKPEDAKTGFHRVLLDIIQTKKRIPDKINTQGTIIEKGVINYLNTEAPKMIGAQGCYTVMDGDGNTLVFELILESGGTKVNVVKYDPLANSRKGQINFPHFPKNHSLHGFIVRANELHNRVDSMDNVNETGRYYTGTYNVLGMLYDNPLSNPQKKLTPIQLLQGDGVGPADKKGYEFIRYGSGKETSVDDHRDKTTIAVRRTSAAEVIQGVKVNEDPLFTTMWTAFGNSNYSIAVPVWATVEDIPEILNYRIFNSRQNPHNLFLCSKRLTHIVTNYYSKTLANNLTNDFFLLEDNIQKTVFPFEKRVMSRVNHKILPEWKKQGVTASVIDDMWRVESQISWDAYNVLNWFNAFFYKECPDVKSIIDKADTHSNDPSLPFYDPELAIFECRNDPSCIADPNSNSPTPIIPCPIPIEVHDIPDVTIQPPTIGPGYTVSFTANVIDTEPAAATVSVTWDFGDNSLPSDKLNPTHTYSRPGRYLVSCTATDGDKMSDTDWIYVTVGGLTGQWDFNQRLSKDLGMATVSEGEDLVLSPPTATLTSGLSGIGKYDRKVTVGTGDYFELNVGPGTVNQWTLVFDVYFEGKNIVLLQTDPKNSDNADFWIGTLGKLNLEQSLGTGTTPKVEKSRFPITNNAWTRIVLTMDKPGKTYSFYFNGKHDKTKSVLNENVLNKFLLNGKILLFADDSGDDQPINVSMVAFFNQALSKAEAEALGKAGDKI